MTTNHSPADMKILFVHGLASSGAYKMATMLGQLLRPCEVVAPDFPIVYGEAMSLLRTVVGQEDPDLVVGLSWGGFLVQKLYGRTRVLVNPDLEVAGLMRKMTGRVEYLSPRRGGETSFEITPGICDAYALAQETGEPAGDPESILGLFADNDEMVDCRGLFSRIYPGRSSVYPGGHLPNYPQMKFHIVPRIQAFIAERRVE